MKTTVHSAFINRKAEMRFLVHWVAEEPMNILFLHGPKSSGKTTLLQQFIAKHASNEHFEVKHINLREILISRYQDFIRAFFAVDFSQAKGDVKEKRQYDLKVFTLSVEVVKGLEANEIEPFSVMKKELSKLRDQGIRPIIIIDELQALAGVYMNGQRQLLQELFNFFVAMTKEAHLCHIIIASSDGYFIERIYNDSKLKKTSKFIEVDYLAKDDVFYWLGHLQEESGLAGYTLTSRQIERIWQTFGGSCWEISRFLADILMQANHGAVADQALEDEINKVCLQMRSMFVEYAYTKKRRLLFKTLSAALTATAGRLRLTDVAARLDESVYDEEGLRDELANLVQQNFLAYNPVLAEYTIQGNSMMIGLRMFVEEEEARQSGGLGRQAMGAAATLPGLER